MRVSRCVRRHGALFFFFPLRPKVPPCRDTRDDRDALCDYTHAHVRAARTTPKAPSNRPAGAYARDLAGCEGGSFHRSFTRSEAAAAAAGFTLDGRIWPSQRIPGAVRANSGRAFDPILALVDLAFTHPPGRTYERT